MKSLDSHRFFVKQRTFFDLKLIGQKKSARLVLGALYVKLNFVREVRREPGAANDTDFIPRKPELWDGLCEADKIIDRGLSHARPPCIIRPTESGTSNTVATALRDRQTFQRSVSGNPNTHKPIFALIGDDAIQRIKFFSCFCQRENFRRHC